MHSNKQLRALQSLREQARAMATMLQGPGGVDADAKEAIGLVDPAQTLRLSFRVRLVCGHPGSTHKTRQDTAI